MSYFFTSESVSEGHPDKIADQISDALVDNFLAFDPKSKVACETLVTTGQVIVAGEVKSNTYLDVQDITRSVINNIGYTKSAYQFDGNSCGIMSAIHSQSADINRGVERKDEEDQGAGDQGMMFGYASKETEEFMPLALSIAHKILVELAKIRKETKEFEYLRPDAKSQVTIQYSDNHKPERIDSIVISTQHDEFDSDEKMHHQISSDLVNILMPKVIEKYQPEVQNLFGKDVTYHINPTGKFVIGGPHGDTGLTGRKIIVDTYGGKGAHGGGAFSGKDPSKVDRSAAYATRHIAKNAVAAGLADEILVQVSYAIGVAQPTGLYVNTYGSNKTQLSEGEIARKLLEIFDMRPVAIETRLKLRTPIYSETAAYGHMGRTPEIKLKTFIDSNGEKKSLEVELFPWEKLNFVDTITEKFNL